MAVASQRLRPRRARSGGGSPTVYGGRSSLAAEAQNIVRRAAGAVAGKTIAAQIRQAARHLGYPADDWRVREAWYGRAGAWSAAAVDDLRRRCAASQAVSDEPVTLAQRLTTLRKLLTELSRQIAELEAEVWRER